MVKGTSKRVVVVKSPDSRVFEQAIFIVREDFLSRRRDSSQGDILREAQDVADNYIRTAVLPAGPRRLRLRLPYVPPAAAISAGGVCLAGIVWLALHFFFGIL